MPYEHMITDLDNTRLVLVGSPSGEIQQHHLMRIDVGIRDHHPKMAIETGARLLDDEGVAGFHGLALLKN